MAKKKQQKTTAPVAPAASVKRPYVKKEIPDWETDDGFGNPNLARKNFPGSRDGQIAYCDWQTCRIAKRRADIVAGRDDLAVTRKQRRVTNLAAQLAKLQAELDADTG